MATFTYRSFTGKQGVLVGYGGGWTCTGFGSPCTQDASGNNYGPIVGTSTPGALNGGMYLSAIINPASNEFVGAVSMSFTIRWKAVATFTGGTPTTTITPWTSVGPLSRFPDPIPYTSDGVSVSHDGAFGYRPTSINLRISVDQSDFGEAAVTLAFSGISFEIHDVVYGTPTSAAGNSAAASPPAGSTDTSLLSSTSSTIISATNNTFILSSTSSYTTFISGHETVIQTVPSQLSPASESQSQSWSLPVSPGGGGSGTPMTVSELAGVIAGSLVGVAVILIFVAIWYQWRRRKRVLLHPGGSVYGDEQNGRSPETRQSWVPNPYRKQPYSRTTTMGSGTPEEDEETETSETDLVQSRMVRIGEGGEVGVPWRGNGNESSIHALDLPPPAYAEITPRRTSRTLSSSTLSTEE